MTWLGTCVRTDFGKVHCIRCPAAMELSPGCLCLCPSLPLCVQRGVPGLGAHRCPWTWNLRALPRGGGHTKVSGGGTLQVRSHTSSPGRSDQAKGTHVQMLRGGNGGYKMEL